MKKVEIIQSVLENMKHFFVDKPIRNGLLAAILFISVCPVFAQSIVYHVENFGFFDNRETKSPYQISQTMFGTRLGAELGVKRGANSVYGGYVVLEEFGNLELAHKEWTFYYQYRDHGVTGAFGSFPRRLLRRELPESFLDDSIRYYTPNMYGALIQRTGENGFAELYCNWRGRQSHEQREIFEISADGEYAFSSLPFALSTGFFAQLTHFSVRKGKTSDKVYDKVMLNPYVSTSFNLGFIDTFTITAGALASFNRDRTDKIWKTPLGFMGDVQMRKGAFELGNHLYVGKPQLTDFERYGMELHQGDSYYRSAFYDRIDVTAYLLERKNLDCHFTASFHFSEGVMDNTQALYVHILF